MIEFNRTYYKENNIEKDHNHYELRARWIRRWMKGQFGRLIIIGAGFGWTVNHLQKLGMDAIGIEKSKSICDHSFIDLINKDIKDYQLIVADNLFSWNVLECFESKHVEQICRWMNVTHKQIHIICTDNHDLQSEQYSKDGYFIKPMSYWINLLPKAILVDYHTGTVYNKELLKIPLSWDKISE